MRNWKILIATIALWTGLLVQLRAQQIAYDLEFSRLGIYYDSVCVPGRNLRLNAVISNKSDRVFEGVLVAKIAGLPDQQFEWDLQFPSATSQSYFLGVPIPSAWKDKSHFEVEVTIFAKTPSGEKMADREGIPLRQSLRIPIDLDPVVVNSSFTPAPFTLPWWYWPQTDADFAYESIIAAKTGIGGNRMTLGHRSRPLPIDHRDWQSLDVIVLSNESMLNDANNWDAISRFIDGGGIVWAMADKIPISRLQPLLCPGNSVEELDSVQLKQATIEVLDGAVQAISVADRTVQFSSPGKLVRVVQSGGDVKYSIDGWPVAIVFQQGQGKLVLTTLDMKAWIQKRSRPIVDASRDPDFELKLWCMSLCKSFVTPQPPSLPRGTLGHDEPEFGRDYANSLIGNPVVPRRTISLLLAGFLLTATCAATWCWWKAAWQISVLLIPTIACLFAGGAMIFARGVRRDVPEMSASLSMSHVSSNGNSTVVRQQGAMHLLNQRELRLESTTDGSAWVDSENVSSGVKKFRRSSLSQWALGSSSWPPGVWGYQAEYVEPRNEQLAEGVFTSQGLEIRLPTHLAQLEDCIFSFQPGRPLLGKKAGENWIVDGTILAGSGRWTTDTVLDDEQLRRQRVLDGILSTQRGPDGTGWTNRILGWRIVENNANWSDGISNTNTNLEILPIRLIQPPLQQQILVPSGAIGIKFDRRRAGRSSAFREESGSWEENSTQSTKVSLDLSLPRCLVPFTAQSVSIHLDISAPKRTVRLWNNSNDPPQLLATLESPSIPWSQTFLAEQITFDKEGILHLMLEVSDRTDLSTEELSTSVLKWHVKNFDASCRGQRQSLLP